MEDKRVALAALFFLCYNTAISERRGSMKMKLITAGGYRLRVEGEDDYLDVGANGLLASVKGQSVANETQMPVMLEVMMVNMNLPPKERRAFWVIDDVFYPVS